MFSFFKSKSPIDKLYLEYEKLLKEAHSLSTKNRTASDEKYAQAEAILVKIDQLKETNEVWHFTKNIRHNM